METSSSSEESDGEAKNDTVRRMDSSNPFVRLSTFGKLKQVVTSYKDDKLDTTDNRILRGLFRKHLRDFDEHQEVSWNNLSLLSRMTRGVEFTPGGPTGGPKHQESMTTSNIPSSEIINS